MSETTPMALVHARAMIDRAYSEAGRFQWAREVALNAIEAGATQLHFGLERNGVASSGVYRRFIADDGCGMDEDELVRFFRTLGGSSKAVGGAHDNYGIGAKISLLPWNTAGLVVASWKGGEGNVIWAKADSDTGEYGLRQVQVDDVLEDVWPVGPDPDLGFDTSALKPDWIGDNGTVLLLLGDQLDQHTILNDPRRDLSGTRQLRDYLTRRFWKLPANVTIRIDELAVESQSGWWKPNEPSKPLDNRKAGCVSKLIDGLAAERGTVKVKDGTRIHWYLSDGVQEDKENWSWQRGFVAALYQDELYEQKRSHLDFRLFGIGHKDVRGRLWLISEPKLANARRERGAFPESDRNSLLWNAGGENVALPWADWGEEFANNMPEPIRAALDKHRRSGRLTDKDYQERLADLFGERFKMPRLQVDSKGDAQVAATGGKIRTRGGRGKTGNPKSDKNPTSGRSEGDKPARQVDVRQGIPQWVPCGPEDLGDGMLAAFVPNHPDEPTVLVNVEHPVIVGQVAVWSDQYPIYPEEVRDCVHKVYGECAVAAVAHSEYLKTLKVDRRTLEDHVRSEAALTMAALGLLHHDRVISDLLKSRLGRRRSTVEAA